MKRLFLICLCLYTIILSICGEGREFSTAGFYAIPGLDRSVYSMNLGWKFAKGDFPCAIAPDYDDSSWSMVSFPHSVDLLPLEASGGTNYQGSVWYRKAFTLDSLNLGPKVFLHFEAIMGKSKIWLNGKLVKEHFGGYLPVIVDLSDDLIRNGKNVITVWADNSDDALFPPGKPQNLLDFTYSGGVYRDCWLISHNNIYITDPNYVDKMASGGFFVLFDSVCESEANLILKTHVCNERNSIFRGSIKYTFLFNGKVSKTVTQKINIDVKQAKDFEKSVKINKPKLWTPESPFLYDLIIHILDENGGIVDGFKQKVGIRSIQFMGEKGFYLNGKPYEKPLLGGNRHQDFAIVGNAMSNNMNWRDAYKLKKLGFNVIRLSHYPQDPSFLDACDELGIFVIEPTPGWQFWNDDSIFGQRMFMDIRNMVRRDRNRPSLLFWEPILNETFYADEIKREALDVIKEEYPSCLGGFSGGGPDDYYPVVYHGELEKIDYDKDRCYFVREYGDGISVNDWSGQNAPNRVSRSWGEYPMLVQAKSYARSLNNFYKDFALSSQRMGGAMWCSFDTQRGYHPDVFYGGVMDLFRQPKYAYYMFMSQREAKNNNQNLGCGPMVYIAHEMTPFSPKDVTVYSNCDKVRLTVYKNGIQYMYENTTTKDSLPHPIITFKDVYKYDDWKPLSQSGKLSDVYMLAEGFIDGKIVAVDKVSPANRPEKVILSLDNENIDLVADGSDLVTVVASIVDHDGNVKRLNNSHIYFEVEGEGNIVGNDSTFTNPVAVQWGQASVLVRSTPTAGNIIIKASIAENGIRKPISAELVFKSVPQKMRRIYNDNEKCIYESKKNKINVRSNNLQIKYDKELENVHKQQEFFVK